MGALATGGLLSGGALVFGGTAARGGAGRCSSLELQLEIPKAASSESTSTVKATRTGVHNGFPVLVFLFVSISYSLTILACSIPFETNINVTAGMPTNRQDAKRIGKIRTNL
jgi:hypothetical protein